MNLKRNIEAEPHSCMWQRLPYIFPFACNACCLRAPWTRAVIVRTMNEPARSVVLWGAGKMLEQVLLFVICHFSVLQARSQRHFVISESSQCCGSVLRQTGAARTSGTAAINFAFSPRRRFVWNFFRLENEHLNNCGEFRAVRDISVAPLNADDLTLLDQMMDQEDGVRNRRKNKQWKRSQSISLRRPRLASQYVFPFLQLSKPSRMLELLLCVQCLLVDGVITLGAQMKQSGWTGLVCK